MDPNQADTFQAGKEVAHLQGCGLLSTKGQAISSASTDLPIWQEQALSHLHLAGPNPDLEVTLGGQPPVDPRLLAAVRILLCKDPSELQGRSLQHLGAWGAYLSPANEVSSWDCLRVQGSQLSAPQSDDALWCTTRKSGFWRITNRLGRLQCSRLCCLHVVCTHLTSASYAAPYDAGCFVCLLHLKWKLRF